jgi:hypothetical protein
MANDYGKHKVVLSGKSYMMVSGRVQMAHDDNPELKITAELVADNEDYCVFRAEVTTKKGTFTGWAASYKKTGTAQERKTPIEVAETSAIGRAFGFAGYAIDEGIASADEMQRATADTHAPRGFRVPESNGQAPTGDRDFDALTSPEAPGGPRASEAQVRAIFGKSKAAGLTNAQVRERTVELYGVVPDDLSKSQAKAILDKLTAAEEKRANAAPPAAPRVQLDGYPKDLPEDIDF